VIHWDYCQTVNVYGQIEALSVGTNPVSENTVISQFQRPSRDHQSRQRHQEHIQRPTSLPSPGFQPQGRLTASRSGTKEARVRKASGAASSSVISSSVRSSNAPIDSAISQKPGQATTTPSSTVRSETDTNSDNMIEQSTRDDRAPNLSGGSTRNEATQSSGSSSQIMGPRIFEELTNATLIGIQEIDSETNRPLKKYKVKQGGESGSSSKN
jgi:hypothetical protein